MFNDVYNAFVDEIKFTNAILGIGVTKLGKANREKKGEYFQSFTSLSTGLERIAKLCILLDYYIDHDTKFPNWKYLKNEYGHDLTKTYAKSQEISRKHNIQYKYLSSLDKEIHANILDILSRFAVSERYSNIDFLMIGERNSDPICDWVKLVDLKIFENDITDKTKKKIYDDALRFDQRDGNVFVHCYSETGQLVTSIHDLTILDSFSERISEYRIMYVVQIIRYWCELLKNLQNVAEKLSPNDIPPLSHFVNVFVDDDKCIRRKKDYTRLS